MCNSDEVMADGSSNSLLLLGIDTCGPSGSVALGRLSGSLVEVLGQVELDGKNYSERLIAAVGELLAAHGVKLRQVGCVVAVNGPGSFTGVRVGLSAVKGLAAGVGMPVVAISRLEVLAGKSGVAAAALDAHRSEVFLRVDGRELLAGADELAEVGAPARVAVSDVAATKLLRAAWPGAALAQTDPPTAADALKYAAPRILAKDFVEIALLDGHYLRRSDAEIHLAASEAVVEQP